MLSAIIKALIWVILLLLTLFVLNEWKKYRWAITTVLLMFIIWSAQKLMARIQGLPPGPFRFPGIGCLPQMLLLDSKFPFVALYKMSKTFGSIVYIQVGLVKGVAINGYEALREMYFNDDWIGRLDDKFLINRTFDKPLGLIFSHVDIWKESRRFTSCTLREFGFGVMQSMDSLIQEELEELSCHFKNITSNTNGEILVNSIFHEPMINITWSMVTGTRFTYDDPKLKALIQMIKDFIMSGNFGASLLTSYPFLIDWAPKLVGYDKQCRANKLIQEYFLNLLRETRNKGGYMPNPTNFIEMYLRKIDTRIKDGTVKDVVYSDENLVSIISDILLASTETASNTLAFGILYLCLNPDVQKKVCKEIESVIGIRRPPSMADKEKMKYTQATILEIIRMSTVTAIAPRRLHKDATIGKYQLRKGDTVFVNMWSAAMDDQVWEDPQVFRPERFLDSTSEKIINADRTLPFGAGKRNCIGEKVARASIFIILIGLLQRFEISLKIGDKRPTITPILGFTLSPEPFTAVLTPRDSY